MGGAAHFRIVGPVNVLPAALRELRSRVEIVGAVPRSEIGNHYRWADVFLLPSVCEGSATACYEALAAGLPAIVTPNTGSVVRDGVDGFIVAPHDPRTVSARLRLLASDARLLRDMSQQARERAKDFTLQAYGRRLAATLAEAVREAHS
jgi:glycosyltransferase involved in cell wall biosynthesis